MNKSNQVFGLSLEKRPLSVIEFASDQVGKKDAFLLFNHLGLAFIALRFVVFGLVFHLVQLVCFPFDLDICFYLFDRLFDFKLFSFNRKVRRTPIEVPAYGLGHLWQPFEKL